MSFHQLLNRGSVNPSVKLLPNTYVGLTWGLKNFDAIETDLRLTKDNKIVIFHDAHLASGEKLEDLTLEELLTKNIPNLETFLNLPQVQELSKTRKMYLELKPNCNGTERVTSEIATTFYQAFQEVIANTSIDTSCINIISFAKDLLDPFVNDYPCFPLLPDVNECNNNWVTLKAMPQVLGRSLTREMKMAEDRGYSGLFFARQYVIGLTSIRHPSYSKTVSEAKKRNMLLGTNLGTPDLEEDYPDYARFTDKVSDYPRYANEGEGPIVAHRGTGTKGVEVPVEDVPDLSI